MKVEIYTNALTEWLLKQSKFGILLLDTNFVLVECNQWFNIYLGNERTKNLIGKNLFEQFPSIVEKKLDKYFIEAMEGKNFLLSSKLYKYLIPIKLISTDDKIKYMDQSIEIIPLMSDQKVIGVVVKIDDITETILSENKLKDKIRDLLVTQNEIKKSHQNFLTLTENSPDIIARLDRKFKFLYVNNRIEDFTTKKPEDYLGKSILDLNLPLNILSLWKSKLNTVINEKIQVSFDNEFTNSKGHFVFETRFIPEFNENRDVESIIVVTRNVTDIRKSMEKVQTYTKELEEAIASKDKFFSIIAHDLKGPFNSLFNFTKIILEEFDTLSKQKILEYFNHIYQSIENIYDLLTNLLEWAQIQRGKMVFSPTSFNLKELIDNIIETNSGMAKNKKITLKSDLNYNLQIIADKKMLSATIHNLVVNGIKFTNIGGEVEISVKNKGISIEIMVKDNGVGMSKNVQENLFIISKVRSSRGTADETGTGLGLILSKEMIDFHKGKIEVQSEEGKGTTFTIEIPQ